MDYIAWRFWIDSIVLLAVCCNLAYTWWTNRAKVNSTRFKILEEQVLERATRVELQNAQAKIEARIEKNEKKVDEHEGWLTRLNEQVKHIPNHKDHTQLAKRVEEVHSDLHELVGSVKGLTRAVDLMNEFLINNGGKS